ncbi:hypothetical protein J437_LFUL000482 [Ladona fulva]|uniref:Extracellular superoxide dismutase [Cu-Zn] n=1 Tax=Ladona fulva TaxID=123851 RepID=A0A8K0PA21_LADFU|nr:hypothetical protein J437_LFUL000482 [Ladona fulva]
MEFAVQMHCKGCVDSIKSKLDKVNEISKIDINLDKEQVVIESTLPSAVVQKLIEDTGRRAVLKGIGGFPKAVAVLGSRDEMSVGYSDDLVFGVIRFIQVNQDECVIEGVVDGLSPGLHGLHIHESGDISHGCQSIGDHYNPLNAKHGDPSQDERNRHLGDLGNITADEMGRATFRMTDRFLKTWDLVGRSVAVTEGEDDLGAGNHPNSLIDGNSGRR